MVTVTVPPSIVTNGNAEIRIQPILHAGNRLAFVL